MLTLQNKSQGQTLKNVGLYLPRPVFGHGQLYVALSRVGDPRFIKVLVMDTREQGRDEEETSVFTVNIVYPEILAEARRLLRESLASQTSPASSESITCMRCDPPQRQNDPQPMVNSSETTPAQAANDTCDPSNAPHDDDVDADAVDANIERNLLAPLRSSGIQVPNRLLTQQEAWALAHHASAGVTSVQENELLDPWDNNQFH